MRLKLIERLFLILIISSLFMIVFFRYDKYNKLKYNKMLHLSNEIGAIINNNNTLKYYYTRFYNHNGLVSLENYLDYLTSCINKNIKSQNYKKQLLQKFFSNLSQAKSPGESNCYNNEVKSVDSIKIIIRNDSLGILAVSRYRDECVYKILKVLEKVKNNNDLYQIPTLLFATIKFPKELKYDNNDITNNLKNFWSRNYIDDTVLLNNPPWSWRNDINNNNKIYSFLLRLDSTSQVNGFLNYNFQKWFQREQKINETNLINYRALIEKYLNETSFKKNIKTPFFSFSTDNQSLFVVWQVFTLILLHFILYLLILSSPNSTRKTFSELIWIDKNDVKPLHFKLIMGVQKYLVFPLLIFFPLISIIETLFILYGKRLLYYNYESIFITLTLLYCSDIIYILYKKQNKY